MQEIPTMNFDLPLSPEEEALLEQEYRNCAEAMISAMDEGEGKQRMQERFSRISAPAEKVGLVINNFHFYFPLDTMEREMIAEELPGSMPEESRVKLEEVNSKKRNLVSAIDAAVTGSAEEGLLRTPLSEVSLGEKGAWLSGMFRLFTKMKDQGHDLKILRG